MFNLNQKGGSRHSCIQNQQTSGLPEVKDNTFHLMSFPTREEMKYVWHVFDLNSERPKLENETFKGFMKDLGRSFLQKLGALGTYHTAALGAAFWAGLGAAIIEFQPIVMGICLLGGLGFSAATVALWKMAKHYHDLRWGKDYQKA